MSPVAPNEHHSSSTTFPRRIPGWDIRSIDPDLDAKNAPQDGTHLLTQFERPAIESPIKNASMLWPASDRSAIWTQLGGHGKPADLRWLSQTWTKMRKFRKVPEASTKNLHLGLLQDGDGSTSY